MSEKVAKHTKKARVKKGVVVIKVEKIPKLTKKEKKNQLLQNSNILALRHREFRDLLIKKCSSHFTILSTTQSLIQNVEIGVFNYTIRKAKMRKVVRTWQNPRFVQLYLDRFRSVFINLKYNADLQQQLFIGEISMEELSSMTHQQMKPLKWERLIESKRARDFHKYDKKMESSTDTFTCRRCKSKRCTYYQVQIRSADEPMTVFVTCLDCNKNWSE